MNNITRFIKTLYNRRFHRAEMDAKIEALHYNQEGESASLEILARHPALSFYAQEFTLMFIEMQEKGLPTNFIDLQMFDPATMETYSVRVERGTRPGPAEQITELKNDVADLTRKLAVSRADAEAWLKLQEIWEKTAKAERVEIERLQANQKAMSAVLAEFIHYFECMSRAEWDRILSEMGDPPPMDEAREAVKNANAPEAHS